MAFEQKEGQGVLFNNDRKEKENHPDLKGEIKINGKLYWLSGWKKSGNRGEFISVSIGEEKQVRSGGQSQRQTPARTEYPKPTKTQPINDDSDSVPF